MKKPPSKSSEVEAFKKVLFNRFPAQVMISYWEKRPLNENFLFDIL